MSFVLPNCEVLPFKPWAAPVCHLYGNRCGHDVESPNLKINLKPSGKMHDVLVQLMDRIEGYMYDPHTMEFLELSRGSARQTRSERRQSIIKTLKTLLHFLDLPTMKIARFVRATGELKPITIKDLHVYSGLSLSRFKRAWETLVDSGLFCSVSQYEKEQDADGCTKFRGLPSIKFMRKSLFTLFGLDKALDSVKRKKRQSESKKLKKQSRAQKKAAELERVALSKRGQREVQRSINEGLGGRAMAVKTRQALKRLMSSKAVGGVSERVPIVNVFDEDDDLLF